MRSGDEKKIKEAVRELRRWLNWVGPQYFGLAVQDTWIAAPPERRQMIEEMARALGAVHPEAARWAQYYIERARRAEAEGQLRPRVIVAQVLRAPLHYGPAQCTTAGALDYGRAARLRPRAAPAR